MSKTKIEIKYTEEEYKAIWWINALNNNFSSVVDWERI